MWFYNTTLVLLVRANDGSGVITVRTLGSLFEENKSHTHYIYCSFDESAIATFKLKDAIDLQRQKQLEILRMPRQAIECTDTNVTCKQVCAFICFLLTHKTPPFDNAQHYACGNSYESRALNVFARKRKWNTGRTKDHTLESRHTTTQTSSPLRFAGNCFQTSRIFFSSSIPIVNLTLI